MPVLAKIIYENIPQELKDLPQWLVWRYENIGSTKPTKIPYNPKSRFGEHKASTTNPATWGTFKEACFAYENIKGGASYDGIGFVFSVNDPYTFIDLDETINPTCCAKQATIFERMNSYAEVSPSGHGLHIIVKGYIPKGRHRDSIEVYSTGRYATFTGDTYPPLEKKPIADCNGALQELWESLGEEANIAPKVEEQLKELYTDEEIISQALSAVNNATFKALFDGRWQNTYPSQSEADFALIDIISFYTQNKNQITRIFHKSALGKRPKAKRQDYLNSMITKSFDRQLPKVDIQGFKEVLEQKALSEAYRKEVMPPDTTTIIQTDISPLSATGGDKDGSSNGRTTPFEGENGGLNPSPAAIPSFIPPGLLGELTCFIHAAAPRPVWEIALAGAIGLMAGITGRAYNVSNTGLNQYILLLAKTGMGKEGMASGIDKLMNAVRFQVPTANDFIGPSYISSGQALVKYVHKRSQCFVSILGEFGIRLQNMSSPMANPHEKMLKQILLELYQKSSKTSVYRASIHADLEKNTEVTQAPAFSLLGESTPFTFYQALNEEMISEGLLPRFLIIEYNGFRPDLNEGHELVQPSNALLSSFSTLLANCSSLMHSKKFVDVQLNPAAAELANKFDKYATARINETSNEVTLNLWNRAHLKAIKLSALAAIGLNIFNPTIDYDNLDWSIKLIVDDIEKLSARFSSGDVGQNTSETKQQSELVRIIKEFYTKDWDKISKYTDAKNLFDAKIVPYGYLNKRLSPLSAFRNDPIKQTLALKRAIQNLIDTGDMREIGKQDMSRFNTSQRSFILTNLNLLSDK